MNISTCKPGTVLQSLGTLILDMPSFTLNSLQHICQPFTNGSVRLVQSVYKKKGYAGNIHFLTSLRQSSKILVYATLKPEENDQSSVIEIFSVHRDILFRQISKR